MKYFQTREEYLSAAIEEMRQSLFGSAGFKVPGRIRVSCGFPKGARGSKTGKAIGQCWTSEVSEDKSFEIFISPVLSGNAPVAVLATLVHEIVHTVAGLKARHGSTFKRIAIECGLAGKMTATFPGEDLTDYLTLLAYHLGKYPHGSLSDIPEKHPGSRLVKAVCPCCGYTIRTTRKWIENAGLPVCPCGENFEEIG